MLFNKTKTLVFLFTIFLSSFTYSQTTVTLYTDVCDIDDSTADSAVTLTYIGNGSPAENFGDPGQTANGDDNPGFDFTGTGTTNYYFSYNGDPYSVTFADVDGTGTTYNITTSSTTAADCPDDGDSTDDGIGSNTVTLYTDVCDIDDSTADSAVTLTYTPGTGTAFGDGGETANGANNLDLDFTGTGTTNYYFSYNGDPYSVTFADVDGTGTTYNITTSSTTAADCPDDGDSTDDGIGSNTVTLYTDVCDIDDSTADSAVTLTYTPGIGTAFGDGGETANGANNLDLDFTGTGTTNYYFSYNGDPYSVTFADVDGTGTTYNITTSSTTAADCPDDGDSTDDGIGSNTVTLYTDVCDIDDSTADSAVTLTYTPGIGTAFGDGGETANGANNLDLDFTGTGTTNYYFSYNGDPYSVTFADVDGTGTTYNITTSSTTAADCPDDGDSTDDGIGSNTVTLYTDVCDIDDSTADSAVTLTYTPGIGTAFGDGGETANGANNLDLDFTGTGTTNYYFSYNGDPYSVTFADVDGTGTTYNITTSSTTAADCPDDGDSTDDGIGSNTVTLYTDVCDIDDSTADSAVTLTYTPGIGTAFGDGGETANGANNLDLDFTGTGTTNYYFSYNGDPYSVTFADVDGTGTTYNITTSSTTAADCPDDGDSTDDGIGSNTVTLYTDVCDIDDSTADSAVTLTYTPGIGTAFGDGGETANGANNLDLDFTGTGTTNYYFSYNGDPYSVTFADVDGTGTTYNITTSSTTAADCPDDGDSTDDGIGSNTVTLYTDVCDIDDSTADSAVTLTYTPGIGTAFGDGGETANGANNLDLDFTGTGTTNYYFSYNGDPYSVTFADVDGTGTTYNITTSSTTAADCPDDGDSGGAYTPYSIYELSENACSEEGTTLILYVQNNSFIEIDDPIDSMNTSSGGVTDFSATYYYNDGSNTYSITFSSDEPGEYIISEKNLINCSPSFSSEASFTAPENQSAIGFAEATDPDTDATLEYTISGDELVIDASTGVITFAANPDFETKFSYTATVTVTDGIDTVEQDITVTVSDVDEISPEFEERPSTSEVAQTEFTLTVDINEEGIIYYVVVADGASAPSSEEVKAGTGKGGTGELASGFATVDSGDYIYDFSVSGLTGGTDYNVYLVAEDNVQNLQGNPEKLDVTTAELISLTISGISGGDKAYDGTTDATASGTPILVGVESGDDVSLEGSPVFTFASANVGTDITVNTTGYTLSVTAAAKYILTQPTLSANITAADLTVTADADQTKVYGATDPTLTYSITGFVNGDTEADLDTGVSISRAAGEDVDTYTITPSAAADSNYTVSFVTADFTITAAALTVTASDQTKVYGATDSELNYTITGFVNGDAEADLDTGVSISRAAGEDVDTYTITPSAAADSNYTVSFVTADFTITAAALTVTASDQTKVYGATDPELTYSITGFVNGDAEADLDTGVSISRAAGENVDTYTITPSAAADSNYTVSFVTAEFTITAAALTVTASDQTKVYGATDPTLTYSITGFVNGDAEADLDTGVSISRAAGEDVDTYTITPSAAADSNYTVSFVTADFTITAADLTVTASDQTKVYGATDPTLTYSITGFVNGDAEADLDTGVSISRAAGEDVDTYTITPSAAADSNYTVSFVTADFTITAADLTVTASDQTKVYGATDPTLTYSITGFVNGDTEADLDTGVSISRAAGENVDTYTITPSAAADSNYTVSFVTADFTITAADLTVTASDQTKVYGATDPTLTYSITGFVNGDAEADLDTGVSISRAAGENVDTYTITPSAAADSNYTVSFVTADFTITAADLTVTASDQTKVYGATDPTLTYSITGFVNGDAEADLDTGVSISRAAGEDVDTYTITPSAAADSNYTVSFVTADFTITAADLTVTADADQTKVYGATDPTLTYSITGFVNGDTEADLDTGVSISRAAGEDVDTYTITPSAAADSNYTVSFVTADFTITAADLTVTASDQTKVYGATDPTLTYSITGFVNGDTEADLDTGVSISRAAGENVDTYTITPSAAADSNYTVSFVTADFTITAADLTVTASDQTKVYGATDPTLTYSITGFVNGDAEADLDTGVSISRAAGEDVDTYTITPSAAADSNYTVSFVTADFTITAADLTVTASDQTKVYGATDPTLTYSITGFVNGDAEADLDTGVSISRAAGEDVDTYTITPSAAADSNYTVSFVTADFTITAAALTVTADADQTKVYGATDPTLTYSITGFVNGDAEADLDTGVSISRAAGEDVDTYTITPSAAADSNYTVSFVTADFTITAADLTVTADADQTKVYGATDPTLTYSITGFVNGDAEADLDTGVSISRAAGEDVDTYTITPSAAADSNYTVSFVTADFTITAADLTVTASDQTKVYGATDPTLTYSITGFVNGDTEADLDTGVSISRAAGEDVDTYTITPSAAADSNYTVSFVTADFTITAAALTVTADADQTKVYGATDPTLTYSITGFVNGDAEADLDTGVSISRAAGEDVDTYTITPSAAADSNYTVSFVTADFTITAADLTVTADADQTKVYGATDPTLTYSITGFVNGDAEADLDTGVSISRAAGEDVDTYTITPSAAADSNYTVSFVTADFTITAAALTVTASDQTKVYGATDPALTYSITGFVNGDAEADLDTGVSISRAAGEDVDTYTITPSAAADSNYTVSFVTADFTITAAALTVTASDQTKVYGATDSELNYTITGFVNEDTEADLDTGVSISRAAGEDVDTYTITPSAAADSNYTVSFVTAEFTITQTTLTITGLVGKNKVYDETTTASKTGDPILEGVLSNDDVSLGGSPVFTFESPNPGILIMITTTGYTITGSDSGNYILIQPTLYADITNPDEDCDGDGIIDSQDSDLSACASAIREVKRYGFSPNGDGINDGWTIENIEAYPNNVVRIFNRSGKLVFEQRGYQNNWNGESNQLSGNSSGYKLPVGPYLFMIDLGDGNGFIKGWLYINY